MTIKNNQRGCPKAVARISRFPSHPYDLIKAGAVIEGAIYHLSLKVASFRKIKPGIFFKAGSSTYFDFCSHSHLCPVSFLCWDFSCMPPLSLSPCLSAAVSITNGQSMPERECMTGGILSVVSKHHSIPPLAFLSCLWCFGPGHLFDLPAGLWSFKTGQYWCVKPLLSSFKPLRATSEWSKRNYSRI